MKIEIIQDFSNRKKGDKISIHGNIGRKLIARKVAVEIKEGKESKKETSEPVEVEKKKAGRPPVKK